MYLEKWFKDELDRDFSGRLRLRWSKARNSWMLEEKAGRPTLPSRKISEIDDAGIRGRDGYRYVLEVRPGTMLPCPRCKKDVKIPALEFKEAKCPYCAHRFRAVYFPIGPLLLEHIRKIDPYRGGLERVARDHEAADAEFVINQRKQVDTLTNDMLRDNLDQFLGVPKVGYTTSKEFK